MSSSLNVPPAGDDDVKSDYRLSSLTRGTRWLGAGLELRHYNCTVNLSNSELWKYRGGRRCSNQFIQHSTPVLQALYRTGLAGWKLEL